jgi:deoxycytidine triphosphate deaminase
VRETIVVPRGVVGHFYPSSRCVEDGLVLTSGRIEAGYHQAIILGVYNSGSRTVSLAADYPLARISFTWLGARWLPEKDTVSGQIEGAVERTPEENLRQ